MASRNGSGVALLADPVRLAIIARVAQAPCRPSALAKSLGLSRPAISHQLRLLEDAGLTVMRPWIVDGRSWLVCIKPGMERPIIAWLAGTGVRDAIDPESGPRANSGVAASGRGVALGGPSEVVPRSRNDFG